MPKIGASKEQLKGLPPLPPGIYHVRLDKFEPKKPKKPGSDSVNLNPVLKIINHPTLNDRIVFFSFNTAFSPNILEFCHGFGERLVADGEDMNIPGEFVPLDEPDPTKWTYMGPLSGRTARVELTEKDNGKGGKNIAVKKFFCAVQGCTEKHKDSLL